MRSSNACIAFQNKEKLDIHSKKAHTGREKSNPTKLTEPRIILTSGDNILTHLYDG